jgi:hypothetical protein
MLGFGSNFFMISMLVDKAMMIISRYGGLILSLFISFILSSYLYFIVDFGWHSLIEYNLLNRPEIVVKYFWSFLKNYYYQRANLPILVTGKIIFILVVPYLFVKLVKISLHFLIFYIAMKIQHKLPTISQFVLRRTAFANSIARPTQVGGQKTQTKKPLQPNANATKNQSQSQQQITPKVNLRK